MNTKFDIGEKVYYIDQEKPDYEKCECCGNVKQISGSKIIRYSTISEISIKKNYTFYQLVANRVLTEQKIYKNIEEAKVAGLLEE